MNRPATILCLVLWLSVPACASSDPGTEEGGRIAFVEDLSAPDADEHALPALQAVELALAGRTAGDVPLELVVFDLAIDPSAVEEVASDPSFVAAIVGPGADGSALAEAGVPTVSVSTAGPPPERGPWRHLVAPIDVVADAVTATAPGVPCVLSEDPAPDALAELLAERVDGPRAALPVAQAALFVEANDCEVVAWAGSPDPGAELARALPGEVALVGGDRLLDPDFLDDGGVAVEGSRAICACADVSTSTDPEAMRFIQDYQSEFGTAPGPYAVETWDAVAALMAMLRDGADRDGVAEALEKLEVLEGLGTTYRFVPSGELADPARSVGVFELRLGRWVRVEPAG